MYEWVKNGWSKINDESSNYKIIFCLSAAAVEVKCFY
jgi:hypothetical protein